MRQTLFRAAGSLTLTVLANAASVIYMGTPVGPAKSTDNGASWRYLRPNIPTHPLLRGQPAVIAIAIDPQNNQTVYMAAVYGAGAALLKTTNGGETFSVVPLVDVSLSTFSGFGPPTASLQIDPVATNVLYLLETQGGRLFKSIDSGATWNRVGDSVIHSIAVDPSTSGTIYATLQGITPQNQVAEGFFRSTDFGSTWSALSAITPGAAGAERENRIFVHPRDSNLILVAFKQCCGFFRTTDGGRNWTNLDQPRGESIVYDPRTDSLFKAGTSAGLAGIWKSADRGNVWTPVSNFDRVGMTLFADGEEGAAIYSSGTFFTRAAYSKSTDGGVTWREHFLDTLCPAAGCEGVSGNHVLFAMPDRPAAAVTHVSAASFRAGSVSPGMVVSAFGPRLATSASAATGTPLPLTLAGTTVTITDSSGRAHSAPLFYAAPSQVNYLLPAEVALGAASVEIRASDGYSVTQQIRVERLSPGLSTLNRAGLAAATVLRVSNGAQSTDDIFQLDGTGAVVPKPIDLGGPSDQVYLTLYGTGFTNGTTSGTSVTVGGLAVPVAFAGPQGSPGLDQVNIQVPRALAGRGEVEIVMTTEGQAANPVRVMIR